jgi:hypothetical protein
MDSSWGQPPPIAASLRAAFLAADFFSTAAPLAIFLRTACKFIFTDNVTKSRENLGSALRRVPVTPSPS